MSVISNAATSEAQGPNLPATRQAHRQRPASVLAGLPTVVALLVVYAVALALAIVGSIDHSVPVSVVGIVALVLLSPMYRGAFVVQPNESRVLVLFGRYVGSVTEDGWWWCNPFITRRLISLRVRNFQ